MQISNRLNLLHSLVSPMRRLPVCLLLFFLSVVAFAQNGFTVKGIVTSDTGEPLAGVSVFRNGSTNGTTTDIDGKFELQVPSACELTVSCLGYIDQKFKAENSNRTVSIVLATDSKVLDEVVVAALGVKRETKALGYAVTEVKGDDINTTKPINPIGALSGKVPGVDISSTTAGPSGSTRVVIRGNGELAGNNQPLYVVDGVPMENSQFGSAGEWGGYDMGDGLSSINPDDIESISVLKGASAAALYGSRATHGVISSPPSPQRRKDSESAGLWTWPCIGMPTPS